MGEQVRRTTDFRAAVLPFVCGVVAVVLTLRSLPELDLGWHLATGLWILDNRAFPATDPFSAVEAPWHAYSWLFELALALVFRAGGFVGLQVLQSLLIIVTLAAVLLSVRSVSTVGSMRELCTTFLSFLLVSPFLYLRPHLLSIVFLCLLLSHRYHRRLGNAASAALLVLWANIHVYWVFMPLLYVLDAVSERIWCRLIFAASLLVLACVSPYGYHNVAVVWRYAVEHQVANTLITEFQSLGAAHGMYLPLAVLSAVLLVCALVQRRAQVPLSLSLFAAIAIAASFYQIKYLSLLAAVLPFSAIAGERAASEPWSRTVFYYASGVLVAFVAAVLVMTPPPSLSPRQQQLRAIVSQLSSDASGVLLNRFDDGGALALYLYLQGSELRTSIDGRTLVMGAKRLAQYKSLRSGHCEVLDRWGPRFAILEKDSDLGPILSSDACGEAWTLKEGRGNWRLFEKLQP